MAAITWCQDGGGGWFWSSGTTNVSGEHLHKLYLVEEKVGGNKEMKFILYKSS